MPVLPNSKHEAFAQNVAKGMSASEAYVAAGYKESRSAASRLSSNVNIKARIEELLINGAQRAEVDVARIIKELARLGMSDVRGLFDENGNLRRPEDWDDDMAAAVSSIEVVAKPDPDAERGEKKVEYVHKIRLWDKNSALEKLAKHLGMFIERHEHTGDLVINFTSDDEQL